MPTLSSLIVQRQIASMREVEEAIARQVLHGGDLLTNLLEMVPDLEAPLAHALAGDAAPPLAVIAWPVACAARALAIAGAGAAFDVW